MATKRQATKYTTANGEKQPLKNQHGGRTKTTRRPTPKQERILNTKQDHPELTTREIAAICDTGHSHVIATFQRYMINQTETNDYKSHRADIFAGIQHKILASVSDEDIKKASLFQKAGVVGLLYDKEQAERGLSDNNTRPLVMIQIRVDKPVDNSVIKGVIDSVDVK